MYKPIVVAKLKKSNIVFSSIAIVFSLLIGLYLLTKHNSINLETYYFFILIASIFLVLSLYLLYHLISFPKILLYSKKIEMISFLGYKRKEIEFKEIEKWLLKEYNGKYASYVVLYLSLNNTEEIYLKCDLYDHFYPIQTKLIKGKPINGELKSKLEKKENFMYAIFSFIFGLFILGLIVYFLIEVDFKIDITFIVFSLIASLILLSLGYYFLRKKL